MADLDPVEYGRSLLVCSVIRIMFWILFRTGFQVARRCWVSSRVFKCCWAPLLSLAFEYSPCPMFEVGYDIVAIEIGCVRHYYPMLRH